MLLAVKSAFFPTVLQVSLSLLYITNSFDPSRLKLNNKLT